VVLGQNALIFIFTKSTSPLIFACIYENQKEHHLGLLDFPQKNPVQICKNKEMDLNLKGWYQKTAPIWAVGHKTHCG